MFERKFSQHFIFSIKTTMVSKVCNLLVGFHDKTTQQPDKPIFHLQPPLNCEHEKKEVMILHKIKLSYVVKKAHKVLRLYLTKNFFFQIQCIILGEL